MSLCFGRTNDCKPKYEHENDTSYLYIYYTYTIYIDIYECVSNRLTAHYICRKKKESNEIQTQFVHEKESEQMELRARMSSAGDTKREKTTHTTLSILRAKCCVFYNTSTHASDIYMIYTILLHVSFMWCVCIELMYCTA